MATTFISPPRIERGRFRTRSTDADWDYFPFGRWGRGYRVSQAERARLQRLERRESGIAALVFVCAVVLFPFVKPGFLPREAALPASGCVAFLATTVWYHLAAIWQVRGHAPATRPLTWTELRQWDAATNALWQMVAAIIASAAMIALGLYLVFDAFEDSDPGQKWFGLGLAFGLLAIGAYGTIRFASVLRWQIAADRRSIIGR